MLKGKLVGGPHDQREFDIEFLSRYVRTPNLGEGPMFSEHWGNDSDHHYELSHEEDGIFVYTYKS